MERIYKRVLNVYWGKGYGEKWFLPCMLAGLLFFSCKEDKEPMVQSELVYVVDNYSLGRNHREPSGNDSLKYILLVFKIKSQSADSVCILPSSIRATMENRHVDILVSQDPSSDFALYIQAVMAKQAKTGINEMGTGVSRKFLAKGDSAYLHIKLGMEELSQLGINQDSKIENTLNALSFDYIRSSSGKDVPNRPMPPINIEIPADIQYLYINTDGKYYH